MLLTGAEVVVRVLIEQGVTDVFGYPGGAALNLYEALYQHSDEIHHYLTAHEQGASHAADGYARATGRTGVVIATSGPGATNLITGLATAYLDSIPVVAITSNVGTSLIGKDSFQEVFIAGIAEPVTKHTYAARDITKLAHTIRSAFRIAQSGRKGPVLVDIPKDLMTGVCEYEPEEKVEPIPPQKASSSELEAAAALINASERPVLVFGGGAISSDASDEIVAFAKKANIPTCHTIMGAGVVGFGDELDLGMLGMHGSGVANTALSQADLLIAAGTRLSDRVALKPDEFAPRARVLQFDIDPSEKGKNIEVAHFTIGDLKDVLSGITPSLEHHDRKQWFEAIEKMRGEDYYPADKEGELRPHNIMQIVSEVAGQKAVVVTDVGQHQMWAAQYCKKTRPRGFITSGGLGTMGFGYGAAIGAKVALPDAKVVHITGDGSFHMNMNECCTAVSYGLQVVTIIMDNKVLGMVRQWQHLFYESHYIATDPHRKTDYVKIVEGFGGRGYVGDTKEHLEAALQEALAYDGPSWIVCPIDKDEPVLPMIPSGKTVDDMILSEEALS